MSFEVARRAIDWGLARSPQEFSLSFFGGEPLLAFDLIEQCIGYASRALDERCAGNTGRALDERCAGNTGRALDEGGIGHASRSRNGRGRSRPFGVVLTTNASLVDDTMARRLAALPQLRALTAHVSLDGPAPVHDRHRVDAEGQGSYAAVRRGIAHLRDLGIPILPVAVVNPDTAPNLGETLEELLGVGSRSVVLGVNLRAEWTETAIEGLRAGLAKAGEVWMAEFRQGRAVQLEPLTSKIVSHVQGSNACSGRCRLALEEVVVAPSGRLYPCGELVGDDVDITHSIGDIAQGVDAARVEALNQRRCEVYRECAGCELQPRCDNYCGCKHVALTGRLGAVSPTLCAIEDALIEAADRVAEALWVEQNPTFLNRYYRTAWDLMPGAALVRRECPEGR